jgi:hypothetical protein
MEVKQCYRCKESKEIHLFKINYGRLKNGQTTYANICVSCVTAENKKWISENRELYNKRSQQRRWDRKKRAVEYRAENVKAA